MCDPIWHVSSCSSEAGSKTAILCLLAYLCAGDAKAETTQSRSSTTTTTTMTVSAAEDAHEPDDEQKIIHELLSRLEPPEVCHWFI